MPPKHEQQSCDGITCSKSDEIESIKDTVEQIRDSIVGVLADPSKPGLAGMVRANKANIEELAVLKLDVRGNGKPGLLRDVEQHAARLDEGARNFRRLWKTLIVVGLLVAANLLLNQGERGIEIVEKLAAALVKLL